VPRRGDLDARDAYRDPQRHARMPAMHGAQQRDLGRHDRSLHHAKEHRALLEAGAKSGLWASPAKDNKQ
jgi:hypothetical protein